jgi:folate-binding protein YgfZ
MQAIDLGRWRRFLVTGEDAGTWLQDLLSADIGSRPARALLLTPTGRIRADVHVGPFEGGLLLIQDPIQPKPIDDLLAPYVLSSDVKLRPIEEPRAGEWIGDVVHAPAGEGDDPMKLDAFDEWRIHEGIPRLGIDLDEDSLPQEAGWERFIDFTKGCFMGQEAMAKIRNMGGHPTRVVRAVRSDGAVEPGEPVFAGDDEVGSVTSAADHDVIVRVTWAARNGSLATSNGVQLSDRA